MTSTLLNPSSSKFTDDDRAVLREVLRHPVLIEAVNIVIREAQPNPRLTAQREPAENTTIGSMLAGMSLFVTELEKLSLPVEDVEFTPSFVDSGDWDHYSDLSGSEQ